MVKKKFDFELAYYKYRKIRRTEEKIVEIYDTDKIKSPVHLSIGQESIAVGCSLATSKDDAIFSNYRGHAHFIAHDGNYKAFWCELFGKSGGLSSGKAGSMHLGDLNANFMFTSAIVASSVSEAVGYALAIKMKNYNKNVICYHGDGAMDQGVYWESINFATLKKLPILFICENNKYAIYSHQKDRMTNENSIQRVKSFGVKARKVKNQTLSIYTEVKNALDKIKKRNEVWYLEIPTTRIKDHVGIENDSYLKYRNPKIIDEAIKKDDLKNLRKKVKNPNLIDIRIEQEINQAIDFAENDKFPNKKDLFKNVLA